MTDHLYDGVTGDPQTVAITDHLAALADQLAQCAATMTALTEHPGDDKPHYYVEAVRLAALARDKATQYGDLIVFAAAAQPAAVPLARLARAHGRAVNTVRASLPAAREARALEAEG